MIARLSVSVVIPALRGGHFLRQALASVLRQDYEPLDIWVVDNGSSDDVREVALAHGESVRPRAQLRHPPVGGRSPCISG